MVAVAERIRAGVRPGGPPFLVGIAGSVAVGKSTLSATLAGALLPLDVAVVATDGFLRPNEELVAEGLLLQKGFPATYDVELLVAFLTDLRARGTGRVPVYSHDTFDRVPGATVELGGHDVVVVEGVNVLQPEVAAHLDLRVYLDAEEPLVRSWFVERFLGLIAAAEHDEGSFYRRFVDLDDDGRRQVADSVWTGINLVNLTEHIGPTRAAADVVLVKTEGHAFS